MLPGKIGNEDNEWSDGINDEANENLPFFEEERAPEEIALHIIDPMDENPDAEAQHTEESDAIPPDMNYDELESTYESKECAHPYCHCRVLQYEFCSKDCNSNEILDAMEAQTCQCEHVGCNNDSVNELIGLQEIQGQI